MRDAGPEAPGRLQGERPAASSTRETEGERSEMGAWTRRLLTAYHEPGTASRRPGGGHQIRVVKHPGDEYAVGWLPLVRLCCLSASC